MSGDRALIAVPHRPHAPFMKVAAAFIRRSLAPLGLASSRVLAERPILLVNHIEEVPVRVGQCNEVVPLFYSLLQLRAQSNESLNLFLWGGRIEVQMNSVVIQGSFRSQVQRKVGTPTLRILQNDPVGLRGISWDVVKCFLPKGDHSREITAVYNDRTNPNLARSRRGHRGREVKKLFRFGGRDTRGSRCGHPRSSWSGHRPRAPFTEISSVRAESDRSSRRSGRSRTRRSRISSPRVLASVRIRPIPDSVRLPYDTLRFIGHCNTKLTVLLPSHDGRRDSSRASFGSLQSATSGVPFASVAEIPVGVRPAFTIRPDTKRRALR